MQIQSGKLYDNRTWKYLFPCLKYYGSELVNHLSTFYKLGIGIGDVNVKEISGNCVYILFDTNIPLITEADRLKYKTNFSKFIDWVKYQPYYERDYIFDSEKHMIVLKVPHVNDMSYLDFIRGNYSKMYTIKELNSYFNIVPNPKGNANTTIRNNRIKEARLVLLRDKDYAKTFVQKVNKQYGTEATIYDFIDAEYDFPIRLEEEIFNYRD